MSALQKVALGFLLTVAPLPIFAPAHPHPAWRVYYLLPNPLGWLLVLAGLRGLRAAGVRVEKALVAAVVAFVVGAVLWFPQLNHYLAPQYNPGVSKSWTWLATAPTWLFGLLLTHELGRAAAARADRSPEMVFGGLRVAFAVVLVLPPIVYGAPLPTMESTMALLIQLSQLGAVVAFFVYSKRYRRETAASE